jgi:peptidoglycan/LPS O-acetylase OafA/YrhL
MQNLQKVYFPGLNGLRFIAAFLVIANHIETVKFHSGYENYMDYPFFTSIGGLSVTLFFVLSGFLITYLLLLEKERSGSINVPRFYIKRILRIWPLYFLVVIAALFIFNKIDFFHIPALSDQVNKDLGIKVFLFLIILPNIAAVVYPSIPYLHHTWSIGVEEQFYLIWPWIIKYTGNYLRVFIIIIITFIGMSASLRLANAHIKELTGDASLIKMVHDVNICFSMFRISCMAIGGIGAWMLFYKKEKFLRVICRKEVQWLTILLTVVLFIFNPNIRLVKHEFYSVLFCVLIINLASNRQPVLYLENKVFNFLGKISYGLYMYHPIAIGLCFGVLKKINGNVFDAPYSNLALYSIVLFTSIVIATASFYLFENIFLKLKDRLST